MARARAGRTYTKKAEAIPALAETKQCVYCSLRFDLDLIDQHLGVCQAKPIGASLADIKDTMFHATGKEQPGDVIAIPGKPPNKVRWTHKYLAELCDGKIERLDAGGNKIDFSWVEVTPARSEEVGFNGLSWLFVEGLTQKVPSPFVAIYNQAIREQRRARVDAPREAGVIVTPGAGFLREG